MLADVDPTATELKIPNPDGGGWFSFRDCGEVDAEGHEVWVEQPE